jgi:ERF superfamily
MTVLAKLNAARRRFHELEIKKTGHNKFAGYFYFSISDFITPALQIFDSLELSAVVSFGVDLASMTLTDLEDGSQFVITSPMSKASLKGCHEVQNLGAVQTYIRRYLWVAALEIVEHDALDSGMGKPAKKTGSATRIAFDNLTAEWKDFLSAEAVTIEDLFGRQGAKACSQYIAALDLGEDEYAGLWSLLDSKTRTAINAITKGKA